MDAPVPRTACNSSRSDRDGRCDPLRDVPWEDIFKLRASAATREFCEWVQVGIDVHRFFFIRIIFIRITRLKITQKLRIL